MIDIIKMLKTHEGPLDMYFSLNPIFSPNRKVLQRLFHLAAP